jgi:hypothetical protein
MVQKVGSVCAGFGLLLSILNDYGSTTIFPWFIMPCIEITSFSHLIFSLVLGWS